MITQKETNRLANIYVSADSVPNDKRMEITRDILDSLIGIVKARLGYWQPRNCSRCYPTSQQDFTANNGY